MRNTVDLEVSPVAPAVASQKSSFSISVPQKSSLVLTLSVGDAVEILAISTLMHFLILLLPPAAFTNAPEDH